MPPLNRRLLLKSFGKAALLTGVGFTWKKFDFAPKFLWTRADKREKNETIDLGLDDWAKKNNAEHQLSQIVMTSSALTSAELAPHDIETLGSNLDGKTVKLVIGRGTMFPLAYVLKIWSGTVAGMPVLALTDAKTGAHVGSARPLLSDLTPEQIFNRMEGRPSGHRPAKPRPNTGPRMV